MSAPLPSHDGGPNTVAPRPPGPAYASPAVRRFARELGVDLARVTGTGPRGRILDGDVRGFVRAALSRAAAAPTPTAPTAAPAADGALAGPPPLPAIDFAKFGPVQTVALSRLKRLSGPNLARNWAAIPHVTNFDEADVTDLEAFRASLNADVPAKGVKVTMLAFLIKALAAGLKTFPALNASLAGSDLVLKQYVHVGVAVDAPGGLVVPVIRDADRKGVLDIAREAAALAQKARAGRLAPADMRGGCITISSLGGVGGTGFTPIVNAPEIAILGAAKAAIKPVWDGAAFRPRLMQPLCLSWDHRAIDGAEAGRFLAHLTTLLCDVRPWLL